MEGLVARYYDVIVHWKDGRRTKGRGVGNNAAWLCDCGEVLLGPHEDMFPIDPCPKCGLSFKIVRGKYPRYVDHVKQVL